MKKIFVVAALVIAVVSCSHKIAPPKTETSTVTTPSSPIIAADVDAGKQTFTAKCGRCHELKNPANYTTDQWVPLVNRMAIKAQLTDTEKANVLAYVQANAKH